MVIEIRLHGALKKFGKNGAVPLDVPEPCSASRLKEILKEKLSRDFPGVFEAGLLERAALADDSHILGNDDEVSMLRSLAILPPVCGG